MNDNIFDTIPPYSHAHDILITNLSVTRGTKSIGKQAFCGCPNLTTVFIPNTVEIIETEAFANCRSLKEIIIEGDPIFQYKVFNNCPSLEKFSLNSQVFHIYCVSRNKAYAVTVARPDLWTTLNQVYIGAIVDQDTFPVAAIKKIRVDNPTFFVETNMNHNSVWFGRYLDVATMGSQYKVSHKSFNDFFGLQLTDDTPISYTLFSLLTGICDVGKPFWDACSGGADKVPVKEIKRVLRDSMSQFSGFDEVLKRLESACEHANEPFNYLDISNLVYAPGLLLDFHRWLFPHKETANTTETKGE